MKHILILIAFMFVFFTITSCGKETTEEDIEQSAPGSNEDSYSGGSSGSSSSNELTFVRNVKGIYVYKIGTTTYHSSVELYLFKKKGILYCSASHSGAKLMECHKNTYTTFYKYPVSSYKYYSDGSYKGDTKYFYNQY